jgi:organic radical activating enzyme
MTKENNWPSKPCLAPLTSVNIMPNGQYRPCCWFWNKPRKDADGNDLPNHSVRNTTLDQYRNEVLKPMYKDMEQGNWPESCFKCNTKARSRWDYYERLYSDVRTELSDNVGLRTLDLRFGNLCNASCITCNFTNSSYFDKVQKQGYWMMEGENAHIPDNEARKEQISATMNWYEDPSVEADIINKLQDIDHLYVTGGEPTINPMLHKILQHLIDDNRASKITLEMNTNGTNMNGKFASLIKPFRKIVMFSVDGYGELNDVMRFPTKFSAIEKNIAKCKEQMGHEDRLLITPTVNIHNFFALTKLYNWCNKNGYRVADRLNILSQPHWQNIAQIPKSQFDEQLTKLEQQGQVKAAQEMRIRIQNKSAFAAKESANNKWNHNRQEHKEVTWQDSLDLTRKWFESRGYDLKLTNIPDFL